MLGRLGEAAIEPCRAYLADGTHSLFARVAAAYALAEIAQQHPEARDVCTRALASALEAYENNDGTLNGFLISYLVDLKAVEHLDLMQRAFDAGQVDLLIMGDFEEVQIALGLLKERRTPPPRIPMPWEEIVPVPDALLSTETSRPPKAAASREKKEKARRKQARKTRRQNRKRKRRKRKK